MNIKQYTDKKGKTLYQVKGYIGTDPVTGKKTSITRRGFKTKKDAENTFMRLKVNFGKEDTTTKKKAMTFEEVFKLWLPIYETTVKESTYQVQKNFVEKHILPHFADSYVDKITTVDCQTAVNSWFETIAKYPNAIGLTNRILEYARLQLKLIDENPMDDIIKPKKTRKINAKKYEAPYYNSEQLNHFLNCVKALNNPQEFIMFRLLAYTGMRQGEVCGLKWSDFDEVNGSIKVQRTVARGKDFKKIIQSPKSYAGERVISLDDETIRLLKDWRKTQRQTMLMFGYNTNSIDQYIITNEKNEFQYSAYPYAVLKKVRKNFDIDHITVHGLRHTHVFLLLEAGVPVKEVQSRLGHENTDMIFQVYDHVNKQKECEVGDIFADFVVSK